MKVHVDGLARRRLSLALALLPGYGWLFCATPTRRSDPMANETGMIEHLRAAVKEELEFQRNRGLLKFFEDVGYDGVRHTVLVRGSLDVDSLVQFVLLKMDSAPSKVSAKVAAVG